MSMPAGSPPVTLFLPANSSAAACLSLSVVNSVNLPATNDHAMPRTKSFNEEDMLDKAKNLFWRKGYHGTPPQEIVDGTGLSRSSLYDTYGDKHTLFLKTL